MDQDARRDDDPSEMTDFEKNTTQGELEQLSEAEPVPEEAESSARERQERGNRGPDTQPGFGQGAQAP